MMISSNDNDGFHLIDHDDDDKEKNQAKNKNNFKLFGS